MDFYLVCFRCKFFFKSLYSCLYYIEFSQIFTNFFFLTPFLGAIELCMCLPLLHVHVGPQGPARLAAPRPAMSVCSSALTAPGAPRR